MRPFHDYIDLAGVTFREEAEQAEARIFGQDWVPNSEWTTPSVGSLSGRGIAQQGRQDSNLQPPVLEVCGSRSARLVALG
jgi:hypothetical protein